MYSINSANGAATLVGATGLASFGSWRSLSTNSNSLYFSNGTELYTLSTTTGAATLIGSTGIYIGAMLEENGILYAGNESPLSVDTLNMSTGAVTIGSLVTGDNKGSFWGLAPNPLPSSTPSVPEPATMLLLSLGIAGLAGVRRKFKK